jgi:hypothetical protein
VFTQTNSGTPSSPRNKAITEAKGKYLCFQDGDDISKVDRVEKAVTTLENWQNEASILFHDYCYRNDNNPELDGRVRAPEFLENSKHICREVDANVYIYNRQLLNFMLIATRHPIVTQTIFFNIEVIDRKDIFFPTDMKIGEDIYVWLKNVSQHNSIYLKQNLSFYRRHETSITQDMVLMNEQLVELYRRCLNDYSNILSEREISGVKKRIVFHLNNTAFALLQKQKSKKAIAFYKESFFYMPNIGSIKGLLRAILRGKK